MKRLEVQRAVVRAAQRARRHYDAEQAACLMRTFAHPMGNRVKAQQLLVAVLILQGEPDSFHTAVKLIGRSALVDLLELRQVDLMARPK